MKHSVNSSLKGSLETKDHPLSPRWVLWRQENKDRAGTNSSFCPFLAFWSLVTSKYKSWCEMQRDGTGFSAGGSMAVLQNAAKSFLSYPERRIIWWFQGQLFFRLKKKKKSCFFVFFFLNSYLASWKPFRGFAFRTWNEFLTMRPKKSEARGWKELWPLPAASASEWMSSAASGEAKPSRALPRVLLMSHSPCFEVKNLF